MKINFKKGFIIDTKNKLTTLFLIFFIVIGCTKGKRIPSQGESVLIKKMNAEDVQITINQTQTTTDGILTNKENFLLVELDKPQVLLKARDNESLYRMQCDSLKNYILDSLSFDPPVNVEEIRFKIIEKHKFFIFTDEVFEMIIYKNNVP